MASKNRTTLKGYFETGDIPSQAQYADLIDSNLNLSETTAQQVSSDIHTSDTIMFNNSNTSGITYADSTGNVRYGLQFSRTSNLVSLTNNAANGFVQIKANGSSAGSGGEVTSSIFTSYSNEFLMPITASSNISASGGGFFGGDIQLDNNQALIGKKLNNVTMNLAKVNSSGLIFLGDSLTNTTYVEGQDVIIGKSSATSLTTVLNDFKVNGNITASGNISASSLISETHITASGNISASGTITGNNLLIDGSQVDFSNLPTSDPGVAGRLFSNNIYVKISQG